MMLVALALTVPTACSPPWPTTCTVGYAGTDLNVIVHGVGADDACGQLEKQGFGTPGSNGNVHTGAGYSTEPVGTLICQYTVKGLTYTVRDQGLLKLYGSAACDVLRREATQ